MCKVPSKDLNQFVRSALLANRTVWVYRIGIQFRIRSKCVFGLNNPKQTEAATATESEWQVDWCMYSKYALRLQVLELELVAGTWTSQSGRRDLMSLNSHKVRCEPAASQSTETFHFVWVSHLSPTVIWTLSLSPYVVICLSRHTDYRYINTNPYTLTQLWCLAKGKWKNIWNALRLREEVLAIVPLHQHLGHIPDAADGNVLLDALVGVSTFSAAQGPLQ